MLCIFDNIEQGRIDNNLKSLSCFTVSLVDAAFFTGYAHKRLTRATSTVMTSSKVKCVALCLLTDACLVASVTEANDIISCSLATGFSHVNDVQSDTRSDFYVLGEHVIRVVDKLPMLVGDKSFALSLMLKT